MRSSTGNAAGPSGSNRGAPPARWTRAGAIAGLIAAVLLAVALLLLSTALPAAGSPWPALAAHMRARYGVTLLASYAGVLTSMALIPFTASLRAFTPRGDSEGGWRWTVTLLSMAAAVSLVLIASTFLAATAVLASQTTDDPAVGALLAGAKTSATFALTPLGAVVLANARTLSSGRTPARWLIRVDLEIGILALVSSAAIFIHGDWFGAGQQVVAGVGILVSLWIAAIALVMLEGEPGDRQETAAR
jgi:hypothetical protein